MARELTELEQFLDAAETLREIQSRRKAIARFEVKSVLTSGPNATVFDGRYDNQPAILKLFGGDKRTDQARAQKRELERLSAFMARGRYRVAPLIDAWPGEGITVTGRIDGVPMDTMLAACAPHDRDALIGGAGQWLAHLVAAATRPAEFGGRYWVRVRTQALSRVQGGTDGELAQALANRLAARLPALVGQEITQARCHGDFAPANLIVTEAALYGIDIQNDHWLPLVKDVARFLVYLETNHPRTYGPRLFGMSRLDLQALTAPLTLLTPVDRGQLLPFFIGVELADKFATIDRGAEKAENLRRAIVAYLDSGLTVIL
ncbi:phosphotransferase family enzyme [Rhodovulum bhavnagarense]|uniref:Phosphotransferase family enzyme n=1 Tax=Rhodovulum bhavnagarense TaxID=992286 RepID=A0A4R2RQS3_9RHOB|nr:phosphotransferase [Rhodovulum bhavnagarense]TCP62191.1 phosphotransferase family enzyme [Rhodovulum bhavnagarense]